MSELKICRICLRTEAKVYNYQQFQLKSYYEEILALKVKETDELPQYFCFECATLLHKFHKFKEKCYSGQKLLKELLRKGPAGIIELSKFSTKTTPQDSEVDNPFLETINTADLPILNHEFNSSDSVEIDSFFINSLDVVLEDENMIENAPLSKLFEDATKLNSREELSIKNDTHHKIKNTDPNGEKFTENEPFPIVICDLSNVNQTLLESDIDYEEIDSNLTDGLENLDDNQPSMLYTDMPSISEALDETNIQYTGGNLDLLSNNNSDIDNNSNLTNTSQTPVIEYIETDIDLTQKNNTDINIDPNIGSKDFLANLASHLGSAGNITQLCQNNDKELLVNQSTPMFKCVSGVQINVSDSARTVSYGMDKDESDRKISYEAIYKLDTTKLKSPLSKPKLKYNVLKLFPSEDDIPIKEEIAQHDQRLTKIENIEIVYFDDSVIERDDEFQAFDPDTESDPKSPIVAEKSAEETSLVKIEPEDGSDGKDKDEYALKRSRLFNTKHWKKKRLSEEEAVKEFRQKAESEKYMIAAYKCTDCFKGFSKQEMLKRHRKLRHNKSGSVECRFCRMRFRWNCHLKKHMREHYTRYECLRCGLVCPLENTALLHDIYHSGFTKKCVHCNEEFRHSSTYYTHLRTHRSDHLCTLCGSSFVSQMGLRLHKRVKHCFNVANDDDDNDVASVVLESPDDDEEVNTFCARCDIRFETRKAYDEHLFHSALHSEDYNDEQKDEDLQSRKILGKVLKAKITSRLKDKKKLNEELFKPQKRKFKRIRRARTKPTTCHQCGKHFETQVACMKHHLSEHPRTSFFAPNERHICEICGASLAPGSVTAHQNMHTRERLHSCETCGRQFHSSVGLKRHSVTHTGEKPYGCTLCDKRFTQNNSMKLHYRTFHLMQPYPKRIRRNKKEELKITIAVEDSEGSNDNAPLSKSAPKVSTPTHTQESAPVPVNPASDTEVPQNSDNNIDYLNLGYQKYS